MNSSKTDINKTNSIWTKDFINIFILNFVMSMGQFMMNTLIPKYAYHLGAVATVVGVVTGIFAVTLRLPCGRLQVRPWITLKRTGC